MNIEDIKKLRNISHAGYADCKKALEESGGDFDKAIKKLREVGHKIQEKNKDKDTHYGVIESYIHPGNRIASMVEIRCETDFVAKTDSLREFAKEVAMQIVAMSPRYISRQDVPESEVEEEKAVKRKAAEKIPFPNEEHENRYLSVQMERWYAENCLLEQPYVRDGSISVKDVLSSLVASVGESCRITKIQRWEIC